MTKPDIVTSELTAQEKPVNRNVRKDTSLPVFEGKCKEMKVRAFNVSGDIAINAFYVTMHKMTKLIGCTYKNGSNVKRFLNSMKDITLFKSKP